ncbi:hypothetical protein Dimus_019873 [Dionaea muscipula]
MSSRERRGSRRKEKRANSQEPNRRRENPMEDEIAHQHPDLHHQHPDPSHQQQQEQREGPRRMIRHKATKLSLEKYLSFLQSRSNILLTVGELNQIISMHGFKKIKGKKVLLVEALNEMDHLAVPRPRSTLHDCISSQAFLTLEDVIRDLTDLNWQECSVTSMKTLHSVDYDISPAAAATKSLLTCGNSSSPTRKQLSIPGSSSCASGANGMQTDGSGAASEAPIDTSCSSSAYGGMVKNSRKRKQRKSKMAKGG